MLLHMRTTINLDDQLFRAAKTVAAREGRTLTEVFEEALRDALAARDKRTTPAAEVVLPVFTPARGRAGLQPGFSWEQLGHESDERIPSVPG
jgi:hypothetical protein